MNVYDPIHIVNAAKGLFDVHGPDFSAKRIPNVGRIAEAAGRVPAVCGNLGTPAQMKACLDAYCGGKTGQGTLKGSFDLNRFWESWQGAMNSSHLAAVNPRAVLQQLLSANGAMMCDDGPPPPGAVATAREPAYVNLPNEEPARIGNCGYTASVPPQVRAGWLAVLGGILTIAAVRAWQFGTGAFFMFVIPEDDPNRYPGA